MESYIRFWRLFPRLALGFLFLFSLLLAGLGSDLIYKQINSFKKLVDFGTLGNISTGIIIIIFAVLFCSLGLFLLDLVCYSIGTIVTLAGRMNWFNRLLTKLGISELVKPASETAMEYLITNKDDLLEFLYSRNLSNPEVFPRTKSVRKYTEQVINRAVELKDKQFIEGIAHYTVTQDRKWLESLKDGITELYYFQITFLAALLPFIQAQMGAFFYICWIGSWIILTLLLLPLLKERRKKYAFYILLYYLDNFSTLESATVADRDAV